MTELEQPHAPPTCPRCGGVHASMYEVAWDLDDGEEDYARANVAEVYLDY